MTEISVNDKEFIWVEKFRPTTFDEIIAPKEVLDVFRGMVEKKQIPNMLIVSPSPGTGKTTCAHALCSSLGIKPLFIAGGTETSVEIIREKVMQYGTTASLFDMGKVVIVDEIDKMSAQAMIALQTTMEKLSSNCTFIFTSNVLAGIPEAVRSRCQIHNFTFDKAHKLELCKRLLERCETILNMEKIEYDKKVLMTLIARNYPDMRSVIQELNKYSFSGKIDKSILESVAGISASMLLNVIKTGNYTKIKEFLMINSNKIREDFYGKLFSALEGEVSDQVEVNIILTIAKYQKDAHLVADKYVHALACVVECMIDMNSK